MKILVTGGAGFIGSHVVDLYLENGHEVVIVDDLSTGRLSNLNPRATFYQMDIRDPSLKEVFSQERPDIVNHHAAQMNVRRSVSDPLFDANVNVVGSLNLIECAKLFQVRRFIYISTGGAVYGEPEYLPCDENHPIVPICQYGISKHTVEHYLYLYSLHYGLESIVLRYPNVYGPRQDPQGEAGVIAIFTGQILASETVTINGDGEQTRDYVYVKDCARANLQALDVSIPYGIFNLGSGRGTSVNELFDQLKVLTAYSKDPVHGPEKIGETRHIYLDASRAESFLGWSFETPLHEGLQETVAYFRQAEILAPVQVSSHRVLEEVSVPSFKDGSELLGKRDREIPEYMEGIKGRIRGVGDAFSGQSLHSSSLREILLKMKNTVGAQSGSVLFLDNQQRLERGAMVYKDECREEISPQMEKHMREGLTGWILRNGKAALIPSTKEDSRWQKSGWELEEDISRSVIG
ncbi:MAG: NAD-dependent epimerase/dehydratase family protein, partial [Anaerolineales bacterium]|nr:NAD-dependent epimerase/dehydratase family protein [Anaerolineales bacterium]